MVRAVTSVTCAFALTFTGACTSFYGPVRPIQAGRLGGAKECPGPGSTAPLSMEDAFRRDACASLAKPNEAKLAIAMHNSAFVLVAARCNDFFAQKAGTQLGVNTAFDSIAPVVALLTGILSLTDFASDERRSDYESALAFGSVALASGLKVYETNFLFSTDNIESVRQLTMDTVNEHAETVRSLEPTSHRFSTSAAYVVEHQMICTPGSIRDLVKKAVQNQKFVYTVRDPVALTGTDGTAGVAPQKAGVTFDQEPG